MKTLNNLQLNGGGDGLWCPPGPIYSLTGAVALSSFGSAGMSSFAPWIIIISDQCPPILSPGTIFQP